jgi:hypothetical protein
MGDEGDDNALDLALEGDNDEEAFGDDSALNDETFGGDGT